MNRTIEDSRKFDVVCMSFGKEQEKGIEVIGAGEKDSFLEQTMEIKAESCNAKEMNFSKEQIEQLIENRKARKTTRALERTASQR